jgi:cation:H+ antiporter
VGRLDIFVWIFVLVFFCGSALLFNGNLQLAFIGAAGVIFEMLLIAMAVEIIIECLKNKKGIGTITGFITNGPEAVCLIVGLLAGDIIFAASTPLGSNFMNPILLMLAAFICHQTTIVLKTKPLYSIGTILTSTVLAGGFFFLKPSHYIFWLTGAFIITSILFFIRPHEQEEENEEHSFNPTLWLIPSIMLLITAGYFLDPVVSFAATSSHAPKGVIGFVVLATLTSWPEFKSCLVLLNRKKPLAAILNITVSNITNIWLAAVGVATYLLAS